MANTCLKGGRFSAPGFRFHPTDEELVVYYLKRKICGRKLRINAIGVVDVYKVDPSELPGLSVLKSGDRQWFYFTPRNRKYPNAARSSRGTATGYWKATGKDRIIVYNSRSVGLKKTLVFYRGRAPNGERTDWVMHEYTMDEEELGRCKNAKEYYALYKLYKKSGAGPKNGEDYGAPFQEEEWVDEDDDDGEEADDVAVPDDHVVVRYENNPRVGDGVFCNPVNVRSDDFNKLLNEIPYAPGLAPRQMNGVSGVMQVNSQEEIESTLLNNSSGEFLSPWEVGMFQPMHSSYQSHVRSADSFDGSEVKSAFKTSGTTAPFVFEKEDYIEMDDLLTPEQQGPVSVEKPGQQFLNPGEYEQFNDYDQLFHDVSMSFDIEPVFQGTSTDLSCLSNFADDGRQNFLYQQQFQNQALETHQANSFMGPNPNANQFVDDLWFKDAQADLYDQPQSSSLAFASPSSGVMLESKNPVTSVNAQDQECQNGGETRSQFSSAMWALLDTIPSTPASACEGPLNRTFVRMSSLSRIRFNGTSVTTSKVTVAKRGMGNRGFILLSVMGALCAFFWVFIIATVGVQGRHRELNI